MRILPLVGLGFAALGSENSFLLVCPRISVACTLLGYFRRGSPRTIVALAQLLH